MQVNAHLAFHSSRNFRPLPASTAQMSSTRWKTAGFMGVPGGEEDIQNHGRQLNSVGIMLTPICPISMAVNIRKNVL